MMSFGLACQLVEFVGLVETGPMLDALSGLSNSLFDGSENQGLPAVPFREPLRHPVSHALQLLVLQRVVQNARPS